jgi:hypothetical protein
VLDLISDGVIAAPKTPSCQTMDHKDALDVKVAKETVAATTAPRAQAPLKRRARFGRRNAQPVPASAARK